MNSPAHATEPGTIDVTMMYAAHDAFRRDVSFLVDAAGGLRGGLTSFEAGWGVFKQYLTIHHVAEDNTLWPAMRAKLAGRQPELDLLDEMEREHELLDPVMEEIDEALRQQDASGARTAAARLAKLLRDHLRHEEVSVLPLVSSVLSQEDWDAFGEDQRRRIGIKGGAMFFPWLLDGAPQDRQRKVLGMVPPPVRLLYRTVWLPRYRRRSPWHAAA